MKLYLQFITLLITSLMGYSQTCIIAKQSKDAIYLGLDSRVVFTSTYLDGSHKRDTSSICKIFSYGKYNFALSGHNLDGSKRAIENAIDNGNSFEKVIEIYGDSFRDTIYSTFSKMNKALPYDSFLSYVKRCQPYYNNVIFFGKQEDSLYLGMVFFPVTLEGNKLLVESKLAKADVLLAGHTDNITEQLGKETWNGDIPKLIESYIGIEIKANVFEVGGQIHLLKFTKEKGLEWIDGKKPPCN